MTPAYKKIRSALLSQEKTIRWLVAEVSARTGRYMDAQYLYRIFNEGVNSPAVVQTVEEILKIKIPPNSRGSKKKRGG